jgi:4-hydroxybenzoate polyprenyltransferase
MAKYGATTLEIRKNMNIVKYQNINTTVGFNAEKILTLKDFILDEFVHGGHLVSLASPAIAISTMILLNLTICWEFLLITYLGTLCIYNYDYIKGLNVDYSENIKRSNHMKKYLNLRVLALISYGITFFSLLIYFGNIQSIVFGIVLLLLGLLYTDVFKKYTKKIVGFKNLYTSISFSLLIIFTPIFYSYQINLMFSVFFTFILLQFIVDTSFCDLKDIETDKKQNLKTLPIFFGRQKFLLFLHVINIASFLILSVAIVMKIIPVFSLILLPFYLYRIYYINKAKRPETNFQNLSGLVDAEYFFWPFVLFLGKTFVTSI